MDDFSERLKEAMHNKRMRCIDLERATGIRSGTISNYRNGKYRPAQENLLHIAEALDVSEAWLLCLTDNPERESKEERIAAYARALEENNAARPSLSDEEMKLLTLYRAADARTKRIIVAALLAALD